MFTQWEDASEPSIAQHSFPVLSPEYTSTLPTSPTIPLLYNPFYHLHQIYLLIPLDILIHILL